MTDPAEKIHADLLALAQKARQLANTRNSTGRRWAVLADRLEQTRDLAVLRNLRGIRHHGRTPIRSTVGE